MQLFEVLDFTTISYTIIVSYSHLNYPQLNFVFWIIKSGFFVHVICTTKNPDRGNHHVIWLF